MNGIAAFAPRWEDGALALSVHTHLVPQPPNLFVFADRIEVAGHRIPHDAVRRIGLDTAGKRPVRHVLDVHVSRDAMKMHGLPAPDLGNALISDAGVRIPVRDAHLGEVRELVRILGIWRDDEAIRAAWGSPAVEERLVPRFDEALLEAIGARVTAGGVEIPCSPPLDRLGFVGCWMVLLYPLLGLGSCLAGTEWTPTANGASGTLTDPTFLLLWVLMGLFFAAVWYGVRKLAPVEEGWLGVGQNGLTLPDGTLVPFEGLTVVHGANRTLRIRTPDREHKVYDVRGDATRLAAAIDALRRTPGKAPAELERLRTATRATARE